MYKLDGPLLEKDEDLIRPLQFNCLKVLGADQIGTSEFGTLQNVCKNVHLHITRYQTRSGEARTAPEYLLCGRALEVCWKRQYMFWHRKSLINNDMDGWWAFSVEGWRLERNLCTSIVETPGGLVENMNSDTWQVVWSISRIWVAKAPSMMSLL